MTAWPSPPWDGNWRDSDTCSRCGRDGWYEDGYLIYITVLASPGEEGYAEVTQAFCQEHYEEVAPALRALGFKSHNHHGTNLLDAEDECGGYGKCATPAEYGPELVQLPPKTCPVCGSKDRNGTVPLRFRTLGPFCNDPWHGAVRW